MGRVGVKLTADPTDGGTVFIYAYNVPEDFLDHRAGALGAALSRPPFNGPRDDHAPIFKRLLQWPSTCTPTPPIALDESN